MLMDATLSEEDFLVLCVYVVCLWCVQVSHERIDA